MTRLEHLKSLFVRMTRSQSKLSGDQRKREQSLNFLRTKGAGPEIPSRLLSRKSMQIVLADL